MHQEEALNLLKMGKNIFLTGEAGAGKTYLLNKYIQYLKENNVRVAITASTGIAATHLQGTTIHSWSGIGVRDYLSQQDLEKLLTNKRIKRNYNKTKVLIIDEISMLHKHQLDMVDMIARYILRKEEAFGGIQVVLCGDFFQLPPVSSTSATDDVKQFAFEAAAWERGYFHVCYLHEQYRQVNDPLHTILNDIRSGKAGEHTKVPLRTRYKKEPQGTAYPTKLYCRNINVEAINERELANIQAAEKIFTMETQGFSSIVDGMKKSCLALEKLKLKIGAEVMFIKNDLYGRYVNGTRCAVIGFDKNEGWPIVKTYHNETITAYPEDWKYEENGMVRATLTQVPLRLAWAITVHKSQGMTLDAAEIDLGDAFEPGMGYVALSRVRSLNGLKLMNLNEMALKVHPNILKQDELFKENSDAAVRFLQNLSENELIQYHCKILKERFKASATKNKEKKQSQKNKKIPTYLTTLEMLKEKLSLTDIAAKRELKVGTILSHLEKLKGLKKIENADIFYLKETLPKEDFELIYTELKNSQDGKIYPIYDKYKGKYSYATIQLVRLFE